MGGGGMSGGGGGKSGGGGTVGQRALAAAALVQRALNWLIRSRNLIDALAHPSCDGAN